MVAPICRTVVSPQRQRACLLINMFCSVSTVLDQPGFEPTTFQFVNMKAIIIGPVKHTNEMQSTFMHNH